MQVPIGHKCVERLVAQAARNLNGTDDATAEFRGLFQLVGDPYPSLGSRVRNLRRMDQKPAPTLGGPTANFDPFVPVDQKCCPRLFQ